MDETTREQLLAKLDRARTKLNRIEQRQQSLDPVQFPDAAAKFAQQKLDLSAIIETLEAELR